MKTYRVTKMTKEAYLMAMGGSHSYDTEIVLVEAESLNEALKKVESEGFVAPKAWASTLEEYEAKEKAFKERMKTLEANREKAKIKRKETEKRKAAEAGMTVEEYRKEKNRKANITKTQNKITELKKELAKAEAYLAKLEKK